MLRMILSLIIFLHGLIHCMGFAKAFGYGNMQQLKIPVSKPMGLLWLLAAFLFTLAAVLSWRHKESWWMIALPCVILSQYIIVMSWADAKWGTAANILILVAALFSWGSLVQGN